MPTGPAIAIVDDDPSVRRALGRLLSSEGFDTWTFASGAELLVSPLSTTAACFLLDVYLDGMSGFELCTRLREAGVYSPVVFISAHDNEETRTSARKLGTVPLVRKPFDAHSLIDAVHAALSARRSAARGIRNGDT